MRYYKNFQKKRIIVSFDNQIEKRYFDHIISNYDIIDNKNIEIEYTGYNLKAIKKIKKFLIQLFKDNTNEKKKE